MSKTAVLLMAYGGPHSLEDIEPYLLDVRGGRPTPPELVEEIRERYAHIGGRSPLLDVTRDQASALENQLRQSHPELDLRVYVGMRHWTPYIKEAAAQMLADGVERVIALAMAPHASRMSLGAYEQKLREAQAALGGPAELEVLSGWHIHPLFIRALVEQVRAAEGQLAGSDPIFYLFTAHSLPSAIMEQGDPYVSQLHETARLLAEALGLRQEQWQFCYQSAGAQNGRWLGPDIFEVIPDLAQRGVKQLLVTPIGFVADHVEVLYDLDVEAVAEAAEQGIRMVRTRSLNDQPTFIAALADVIVQHEAAAGEAA